MGMINTIQERLRIAALLLAAFSLIALAGCGNTTEAPNGSTITVAAEGIPVISNITVTASAYKTQYYRVTLADAAGLPLNDLDVHFVGQFTNGQSINFGGNIGSAPAAPATLTLSSTQQTGDFGYLLFAVSAPYYSIIPIHVPYNQTAVALPTGGGLPDGPYFYTITALDFAGETEATAPISATVSGATTTAGSTGSVTLSWQAVPGATSYNVYGRGTPGVGLMVTILNPSGDPVTFIDVGSYTSGAAPPVTNTTGLSLNSVVGTAQATSGTAFETFSINF
jgi:hypothetical protein